MNKKSCPYRSFISSPLDHLDNSPNCATAKMKTDSPLPYAGKRTKIQGSRFSDIWVETVAVLKSMKEPLDSLCEICDDSSVI